MSRIIKQVNVEGRPVVINNPKTTHADLPAGNLQTVPDLSVGSPRTIGAKLPDTRPDLLLLANKEIEEAKLEAKAIIAAAETKAAQIAEDARKEMEALKQQILEESRQQGFAAGQKQGTEEGYQDGLAKGQQAVLEQMQENLNSSARQASELIQYATNQAKELLIQAERQIIELSLEIARKVVAQQLDENASGILALVKAALDKVRDQEQLTIRVGPADYEFILKSQKDLDQHVEREHTISIVPDQTIVHGGCVIETPYGTVDARIDAQLDELKKVLREVMP